MCTVRSHEFGVVRLYRTFSNYIFTGETRCAGAYALVLNLMSLEWFNCTEPSLTTSVQGKQGVQGGVREGSVQSHDPKHMCKNYAPGDLCNNVVQDSLRCTVLEPLRISG